MINQLQAPNVSDDSLILTPEQARKLALDLDNYGASYAVPIPVDVDDPENVEKARAWVQSDEHEEWNARVGEALRKRSELMNIAIGEGRMVYVGTMPDWKAIVKEQQRAVELVCQKHLPHPFADGYVLLYNAEGCTWATTVMLPERGEPGKMYLVVFRGVQDPWDNHSGFHLDTEGTLEFKGNGDDVNIWVHEPITGAPSPEERPERDDETPAEREYREYQLLSHGVIVCFSLLMINARFVETRRVEVSPKLNKARIKNGKPMLPSYLHVDTEDYVTVINGRYLPRSRVNGGGTHASPAPHLRRAHRRMLPKGDILVREAKVNMTKGRLSALRSHYEIRLPGEPED
jgi:hypothetical protein